MTHIGGAQANPQRVRDFLQVYFQIGDCSFGSAGHHGTPNQRLAAATFGFRMADEDLRIYGGRIRSTEEFHDRFLRRYPVLIAPDAPVAP
jgi:hypothetical protein